MRKQTIKKDTALSRVIAQRTGGWLKARVDEYLESSKDRRYDPGWFHPSALGNPCDALLAFQYMGNTGKGKTGARLQRIFDLGTARDEDWKRYLHESGLSVHKHWGGSPKERKLASAERYIEVPHAYIRGEYDDRIKNPLTGEEFIFEFKTMNRDEWRELKEPKPDHILQTHCYAMGSGVMQYMVVYECKNCQDIKVYNRRFEPRIWQGIEMRLLNIVELVGRQIVPNRVPMQNDKNCAFYYQCGGYTFDAKT